MTTFRGPQVMVPHEKIISNSNIEIPDVMSDEEIFLGY
jgi:hypothetical protein